MTVLLAIVGLLGLSGMQRTNAALQSVYADRVLPLSDLQRLMLRNRLAVANALVFSIQENTQCHGNEVAANGRPFDALSLARIVGDGAWRVRETCRNGSEVAPGGASPRVRFASQPTSSGIRPAASFASEGARAAASRPVSSLMTIEP